MPVGKFLDHWGSHNATRNFVHKEFEASKSGKHGKATKNAFQARGAAAANFAMNGVAMPVYLGICVVGGTASTVKILAGVLTFRGRWIKEGGKNLATITGACAQSVFSCATAPVGMISPEFTSGLCRLGKNPNKA